MLVGGRKETQQGSGVLQTKLIAADSPDGLDWTLGNIALNTGSFAASNLSSPEVVPEGRRSSSTTPATTPTRPTRATGSASPTGTGGTAADHGARHRAAVVAARCARGVRPRRRRPRRDPRRADRRLRRPARRTACRACSPPSRTRTAADAGRRPAAPRRYAPREQPVRRGRPPRSAPALRPGLGRDLRNGLLPLLHRPRGRRRDDRPQTAQSSPATRSRTTRRGPNPRGTRLRPSAAPATSTRRASRTRPSSFVALNH